MKTCLLAFLHVLPALTLWAQTQPVRVNELRQFDLQARRAFQALRDGDKNLEADIFRRNAAGVDSRIEAARSRALEYCSSKEEYFKVLQRDANRALALLRPASREWTRNAAERQAEVIAQIGDIQEQLATLNEEIERVRNGAAPDKATLQTMLQSDQAKLEEIHKNMLAEVKLLRQMDTVVEDGRNAQRTLENHYSRLAALYGEQAAGMRNSKELWKMYYDGLVGIRKREAERFLDEEAAAVRPRLVGTWVRRTAIREFLSEKVPFRGARPDSADVVELTIKPGPGNSIAGFYKEVYRRDSPIETAFVFEGKPSLGQSTFTWKSARRGDSSTGTVSLALTSSGSLMLEWSAKTLSTEHTNQGGGRHELERKASPGTTREPAPANGNAPAANEPAAKKPPRVQPGQTHDSKSKR